MRFAALLFMTAAIPSTVPSSSAATSLVGVWRLVEVNALAMQDTPPRGQINRKEVYTEDGRLLVARPDAPVATARVIGTFEQQGSVRIYTTPDGEQVATAIHWIGADHFYFEFSPGERWYYARVRGADAAAQQWEPRSVAVVRVEAGDAGPTLRNFVHDLSDDSKLRWEERILGAWEVIRVAGPAVSGPDMPPYGIPNDRYLFGRDGVLRKTHANGAPHETDRPLKFSVAGNRVELVDVGAEMHFWFNRWGQLVLEQPGMQVALKRIALDPDQAAPGPFVVVLLEEEIEMPPAGGPIVEVRKSAAPAPDTAATSAASSRPAIPRSPFRRRYAGGVAPADLALADHAGALDPEHRANQAATRDGLGVVVELIEHDDALQSVTVRVPSLDAQTRVPYGWHAVDDARRLLVFDEDHLVHLELTRSDIPATDAVAELGKILAAYQAKQPELKSQLMPQGGEGALLMMPGLREGEALVARAHLLRRSSVTGGMIAVSMRAPAADLVRALNLSEFVLRHLE